MLPGTVRAIEASLGPSDRLHIVADHCGDETLQVPRGAKTRLHVRSDKHGPPGKGLALKWWLGETQADSNADSPVVVLDADTQPAPDFLEVVRAHLSRGEPAVQVRIEPVLQSTTAVSTLAAYSEVAEQRVFDALRARWGWPVRLRGTGMAFQRPVLERVSGSLGTVAEDIELTLLLAAQGTPIALALETSVCDPKPGDTPGAVRQRARWLRGQAQAARMHMPDILRLLRRGPSGWSLLAALFLKPKAFFLPLTAIASAAAYAAWRASGWVFWLVLACIAAACLCLEVGGLACGLRYVRDRSRVVLALVASPLYILLWLRSMVLSITSREDWPRARPLRAREEPSGDG